MSGKKRTSASSYRPECADQVERICAQFGADDKQLAKFFGVGQRTIDRWKKAHPKFQKGLRAGKDAFDTAHVEGSLLRRAMGYAYEESTFDTGKDGKPKLLKRVAKHMAPDVIAQIFWLKNRGPGRWRDRQDHAIGGAQGALPIELTIVRTVEQPAAELPADVPGRVRT